VGLFDMLSRLSSPRRKALAIGLYTMVISSHFAFTSSAIANTSPATYADMTRYTRFGALNVCIFRNDGIEFDKAAAVAGETIAQVIKGQHGSQIAELGPKTLSIEELRKGSINSAVMGAVELCPKAVPADIKAKVAASLKGSPQKSNDAFAVRESGTNPPVSSGALEEQSNRPIPLLAISNIAQLAEAIVVKVETAGPSGSGTLFSRDGDLYTILTACHVLKSSTTSEEVFITTSDRVRHVAIKNTLQMLGASDLCAIRFRSNDTYIIPRVASAIPAMASSVYVAGWALATADVGSSFRFVQGTISGRGSAIGIDGYSLFYTTQSPTLPGMSGGPILHNSELIGIHGRAERAEVKAYDGKDIATFNGLGLPVPQTLLK
jgi:hypothetical protein